MRFERINIVKILTSLWTFYASTLSSNFKNYLYFKLISTMKKIITSNFGYNFILVTIYRY